MLRQAFKLRRAAALALAGLVAALGGSAYGGDGLRMRQDAACRGEAICPGDRSPVWSPDGQTIAFVRYLPRRGGGRVQALYAVPARGGPARRLYVEAAPGEQWRGLTWSPDSRRLAFASGGIWTVGAGGGPAARLTPGSLDYDTDPAWSPDGLAIAFVRYRATTTRSYICCELWLTSADGSSPRRAAGSFATGEAATVPVWSRAGDLAYVRRPDAASAFTEIWSMRPNGEHRRVLRAATTTHLRLAGWAPDGARLFFVSFAGNSAGDAVLEVVNADGTERRRLYGADPSDICCLLSPDVTRTVRVRRGRDGGAVIQVYGLRSDEVRVVAEGVSRQAVPAITAASWSPDGARIAYVADGECPTLIAVHTVGANGRDQRRLTQPCRRVGIAGPDRLRGSAGPQALYGRGGRDALDGGPGPDTLHGDAGADRVNGGLGDDRVYGGTGRDRLTGGDGWDAIYARDGFRDVVACGAGRDAVRADRHDAVARDCELVERG